MLKGDDAERISFTSESCSPTNCRVVSTNRLKSRGAMSGTREGIGFNSLCKNILNVPGGETAKAVQGTVLMFIDRNRRMAGESG